MTLAEQKSYPKCSPNLRVQPKLTGPSKAGKVAMLHRCAMTSEGMEYSVRFSHSAHT